MGNVFKGPFFPREPSRFVKRTIRGMLPHKQEKGRNAFKNIKCYNGVPEKLQGQKTETLEKINAAKLKKINYLSIKELSEMLGHKR